MEGLVANLVSGLVLGLVYAVIALGYTMVYGVLEFINFAHSEVFMFGAIIGTEMLIVLPSSKISNAQQIIQFIAALVLAAVASGILAVIIERVAYRPLRARGAPKLVALITAIGMSFFLQDAVRLVLSLFGNYNRPFPTYSLFNQTVLRIGEVQVMNVASVIVVIVGVLMLGLLIYLVNYTTTGRAIRAVAQDQSTSSLMGINVTNIITITFLVGGALGGVAGVLFALQFGNANPFMGFGPGLKAFTAAVLGGIGSIPGAMLGGIVLGLIEIFGASYISSDYKDLFAFLVLILILLFKPAGLLGKAVSDKV